MFELGKKAKDKISGFEGIITTRGTHLYGCDQYGLTPGWDKDGKPMGFEIFDEGRLEIIGEGIKPEKEKKGTGNDTKKTMFKLGKKARDKETGFEGIITSIGTYWDSYDVYSLTPVGLDKDGTPMESRSFGEGRIEIIGEGIKPEEEKKDTGAGTKKIMFELGKKARDKISGFEGIITGRITHLYDCDSSYYLTPVGLDKDGTPMESRSFGGGRIEIIGDGIKPEEEC